MSHPHHALGDDSDGSDDSDLDGTPALDRVESGSIRQYATGSGVNESTAELLANNKEDKEDEMNPEEIEEEERLLEQEDKLENTNGERGGDELEKQHLYGKSSSQRINGTRPLLSIDASGLRQRRHSLSQKKREPVQDQTFLGLRPRTALLILIPLLVLLVALWKSTSFSDWGDSPSDNAAVPTNGNLAMATLGQTWADVLGEKPKKHSHTGMKTNGTAWFNNTVIIVSLDGLRWDYLDRGATPNLLAAAKKGVRAEHMRPIFPSLTFVSWFMLTIFSMLTHLLKPNHWALQTGLYAESHGIVANDFFDPVEDEHFTYHDDATNWEARWWMGEPMWETVVKSGGRAAVSMWPGPPVMLSGTRPTYYIPYQPDMSWEEKADQLQAWLDRDDESRPNLICMYLWEVDSQGHATGPDSPEVKSELTVLDSFAKTVYDIIEARNLSDIVDVVFVSDHGMTSTSNERLVMLDDLLGADGFAGIAHKEGWPSCGLRFKPNIDEAVMVKRMEAGVGTSKGGYAYYNHSTMPPEYHFSHNIRIAPHYLVPEPGWAITDRQEGMLDENGKYKVLGNHGYNNSFPDMWAFMTLSGPSATKIRAKQLAQGAQSSKIGLIPGFDNVDIYNLVTQKLLGLKEVAQNNGTVGYWDQYL